MKKQYTAPQSRSLHFFSTGCLMKMSAADGGKLGATNGEGNCVQISNRKGPFTDSGFAVWNSAPWSYGDDE